VPDKDHAGEIELVLPCDGPDVVDGASDIEVGTGPPASRFSEPPVFDVPGRDPACFESVPGRRSGAIDRLNCLNDSGGTTASIRTGTRTPRSAASSTLAMRPAQVNDRQNPTSETRESRHFAARATSSDAVIQKKRFS